MLLYSTNLRNKEPTTEQSQKESKKELLKPNVVSNLNMANTGIQYGQCSFTFLVITFDLVVGSSKFNFYFTQKNIMQPLIAKIKRTQKAKFAENAEI